MIYENVKHYADKRGLTIQELEKRAELPNGTIGKWRDATPRATSIMRVANVLNVKMETLLKGV